VGTAGYRKQADQPGAPAKSAGFVGWELACFGFSAYRSSRVAGVFQSAGREDFQNLSPDVPETRFLQPIFNLPAPSNSAICSSFLPST
jgi:hypothetical protein